MGLCKCPKKKVTNLFCFEHRVNVCEHCLVANHPKCIVQSYLQWLQDSDYDPSCHLCGKSLADVSCGQCVRLQCYDVFHWSCLDEYASKLPSNTAPAGYSCPVCHAGLFPANNSVSPVVDVLRDLLATVNWARAGLSLPLIAETPKQIVNGISSTAPTAVHTQNYQVTSSRPPSMSVPDTSLMYSRQQSAGSQPTQSVISMDEAIPYSRSVDRSEVLNNLQKLVGVESLLNDSVNSLNFSHDHDQDKYKRRPALQWFSRWFSSRTGSSRPSRDPNARVKRFFVIMLIAVIGFITLIVIFTRLGRSVTDSDPFLDPMANPNIRVQQADSVVDK